MCVHNGMEQWSDMEYVEKVQAGDAEYFAPLLERYSQPVFSLLVRIVGNREDAEELTQDVFLKVFRSLSSFRRNSSFATWLYRIAYNTAVSATRRPKREWMSFDDSGMERMAEETSDDEADEVFNEERQQRLEQALDQLRPGDRALILLYYQQKKTMEEIAKITGLTLSNVKVKMHRIRKKLMDRLKK